MIIIPQDKRKEAYAAIDKVLETFFWPTMMPNDANACREHMAWVKMQQGLFTSNGTFQTDPVTKTTRIILEFSHR